LTALVAYGVVAEACLVAVMFEPVLVATKSGLVVRAE